MNIHSALHCCDLTDVGVHGSWLQDHDLHLAKIIVYNNDHNYSLLDRFQNTFLWMCLVIPSFCHFASSIFLMTTGYLCYLLVLLVVVGPARPEHGQKHCYHHAPKVRPEAATAVVELLMMGVRTPKTC